MNIINNKLFIMIIIIINININLIDDSSMFLRLYLIFFINNLISHQINNYFNDQ